MMLAVTASIKEIADVRAAKKTKIKLVEKVKYIKPSNDTLQDLIALNEVNDTIIRGLEAIIVEKDSIIWKYNLVTQNDRIIIKGLEDMLAERNKQLEAYSKEILKQKNEKVIWEITTAAGAIAVIVLLAL